MDWNRLEQDRAARRFAVTLLAASVCALVLGGCNASPDSAFERTDTTSQGVVTATGVDFSLDKPPGSSIHAAGYSFAVRYLSGYNPKDITRTEATALWAAGVDVVSNWELCGGDPGCGGASTVSGFATGASDARAAEAEAAAVGAPPGRPIYFSIDFDTQYTTPDPMPGVSAYFDGVASVIGLSRTGAYGSQHTLKYLFDTGKITWGWQTAAWLYGGGWDSRAQVRQVAFNVSVGSYSQCCDEDEAQAADFGQWHAASGPVTPQCVNDPGTGNNCGNESVISDGNADTLYHCAGYGPATVVEVCANGCVHEPPGIDDTCAPGGAADAGGEDARSVADSGPPAPGPEGGGGMADLDGGSAVEGGPDGRAGQAATGGSEGCAVTRARGAGGLPRTGAAAAIALAAAVARRRRRARTGARPEQRASRAARC